MWRFRATPTPVILARMKSKTQPIRETEASDRNHSPSLVKSPDLAHDLDRQIQELAEIVVDFYREWKQQ